MLSQLQPKNQNHLAGGFVALNIKITPSWTQD